MRPVAIVAATAIEASEPSSRLAESHPDTVAFEVDLADVPGPPKQRKLMSRPAMLAAVAARRCLAQTAWPTLDEVGYYLGVGAAGGCVDDLRAIAAVSIHNHQLSLQRLASDGFRAANPLSTFQSLNNFTMCHSAIIEGITGPNAALFSRGAGTVNALSMACAAIADGTCSRALAGGADSTVHPIVWAKLAGEQWDVDPCEGAAIVALSYDATRPLGWLDSFAFSDVSDLGALPAVLPNVDVYILAAASQHEALHQLASRHASRVVDRGRRFCAASPASALVAALALDAERIGVLSLGFDGQLCVMQARRRQPARARPRSVSDRCRKPVITGVGVVSAFGVGAQALFDGLSQGRSAIGPIGSFDATHSPVKVAGEVPALERDALARHLPGQQERIERWAADGVLRDRKTAFALLAAGEAWRQAGQPADAWLSLGSGLEQSWAEDYAVLFDGQRFDWSAATALPRERLASTVDLAARCVRQLLGLRSGWYVNTSACAAGAQTVAHAAQLISQGDAEVVLCGAADSMVNPLAIGGFWALGAPSPRNAIDACRPFDASRDGLVIGEGAALFVLEAEAHAVARGAKPLARVLGWGSSQDAYRATAPRPDGELAARAMAAALGRAKLAPDDIAWINAHGTGTALNDPAECAAIRTVFGATPPPVSSIKGAVGHLMAASGAIELASCLLAFDRSLAAGTAHLQRRDPACDVDVIGPAPRAIEAGAVLSNSFGFGGQNASVIVGPI